MRELRASNGKCGGGVECVKGGTTCKTQLGTRNVLVPDGSAVALCQIPVESPVPEKPRKCPLALDRFPPPRAESLSIAVLQ